ncbi:MAG: energy-coupling factor transporter transmembrane component T [Anaerolineales bacterium]|jgi:energy-coupling factor transport system permease protein
MKQPWAWVSWLITTLVILTITRNPLYLVLIMMCVLFVGLTLRQTGSDIPRPISLWKLAAWIILLATIFNALTSHYGTTVLFTIPGKLPLISGRVTVEAIVYGATNGFVLTGMLASFTVLNLALPVRDLISLIPRAFFPVAVVTSIAVTYLPTTLRQFQQIREAQAVRGHQMRSLRDWLPLLMPLLVGGLEHAMQLAEAMTARGFASTRTMTVGRQAYPRISMLFGLVLLALGWIAQLGGAGVSGLVLIFSGALLILGGIWYLGRQSPRTTYHHSPWSWQDWLMMIVAVCVLGVCLLPIPGVSRQTLYYEAYPTLTFPTFSPLIGLLMMGLLIPGLLVLKRNPDEGS